MNATERNGYGITQISNLNPDSKLPSLPMASDHCFWTLMGAAQSLAECGTPLNDSVGTWVSRTQGAWQTQQCQLWVNAEQQPWAYASWCTVSAERHEALCQGSPLTAEDWNPEHADTAPHVWLVDLITPFGQDETVQRHLQDQMTHHIATSTGRNSERNRKQMHPMNCVDPAETLHPYPVLGMVNWLMNASDFHQQWPIQALHTELMPALRRGQYRLYLNQQHQPIGFVSWANLSAAGLAQVLADEVDLQDSDWDAGEHTMINDFIAPWGHAKPIIRHLRTEVFPTQRVLGIRRHHDGTLRKHFFFRGALASQHRTAPNSVASC